MDGERSNPRTMAPTIHATAIAVEGAAVLLRGPSGTGKSDLALRCLSLPQSALLPSAALLVSDDRTAVSGEDGRLIARPPEAITGKLEVRGLGLIEVPWIAKARVVLIADLVPLGAVERFPLTHEQETLFGVDVERIRLAPFEPSAPIKLLLALREASRRAG